MANNIVTGKIEVLDEDICKNCKYIEITSRAHTYVYAEDKVVSVLWGDHKFYCGNLEMCKYLQKLFASKSTPKVEEAKSDP